MSGPTRYSMWCSATHGHEPLVSESGLWVLHADIEAMRARHVREAVEGLSDKVIHETLAYIVDRDDGELEWWWNDPAAFRAALLAALTGEGK